MSDNAKKILFVCAGNTCRSPMAEVIFKELCKKGGLGFKASSAGLYAQKEPMNVKAKQALKELGYTPPKSKQSKTLTRSALKNADYVFTMTSDQKAYLKPYAKEIYSMKDILGYDVSDPYGRDLETYINTAKKIETAVKKIIDFLSKNNCE
ncbi:MAG TPA: low molecular weight protein arginine phosphatase [Clostridia bacterium]